MPAIPHVRFIDEPAYDRLHLAESDQYFVAGEDDTVDLVGLMSPELDERLNSKFHLLPSVGFVALTKQGNVVATLLFGVTRSAERRALACAAARLSVSEDAVSRRAAASGAVGWLESLARLSDSRDESGAAHA